MKPRNFPSRRLFRRLRARARAKGEPQPSAPPYVDDTRFRIGGVKRSISLAELEGRYR